jgi:PhnB protein
MANVQAVPKGHHTVTPHLVVNNASAAIDFYKKALGASEVSRFAGPDGKIMHAEIQIGDSRVMLGDEMPMPGGGGRSPRSLGGTPVGLFLYLPDVDRLWKQALGAGARQVDPLTDQFWGDRAGCIEDPYGHRWWLAQHIEDVSDEEMGRRAKAQFAQAGARH